MEKFFDFFDAKETMEPLEMESRRSSSSSVEAPEPNRKVVLQVGEQRFITTRDTLCGESNYFRTLLSSPPWDSAHSEDGSYFIDADAELFSHVLRYLRHGICPLIFDRLSGHDYATYIGILQLARQFQIQYLEQWLENGMYDTAVTSEVIHSTEILAPGEHLQVKPCMANVVREHSFAPGSRRVYRCPRKIFVHTHPDRCGKQCESAKLPHTKLWEEELILHAQTVDRIYTLRPDNCLSSAAAISTRSGADFSEDSI
ncbi:hypothetical protein NKR23_g7384 [Pleurostoma richardsiae]|uniref:BTB domain-containing protein n=1 Tax=Pleurostoma richardsiae TaxID=41990 RepID=A0AA38R8C0_9PEZI|nr:hypothetical protein NKR23_g7384 [Pleurostoma richardsiae]